MRLTQMQIKEILSNKLTEPNGVTHLMELILDIAMEGERELYKEDVGDVSNGYRPRRIYASGNMLEIRVPRTRQRGFMPVILSILKNQEQEMGELADYLYSCGNTMEDISDVFERLYGKKVQHEPNQSAVTLYERSCKSVATAISSSVIGSAYHR